VPQRREAVLELNFAYAKLFTNLRSFKWISDFDQIQDPHLNVGQLRIFSLSVPGAVHCPGIAGNGLYPLFQVTILAQRFTGEFISFRIIDRGAAFVAFAHLSPSHVEHDSILVKKKPWAEQV
jgi:hypothetical protein